MIRPKVSLNDRVLDPLGRNNHLPVGYQAHTPDHGVEWNQIDDLFRLMCQGVTK